MRLRRVASTRILLARGELQGFYIRGFTVEGFPQNGIQTRWVNGFKFLRNESANNLNNGIYPTLSANGLVQNNVSYGSLDTAMWVAGSENVRVIGNEVYGSPIGLEITVANNVWVTHNDIHDNTVGRRPVPSERGREPAEAGHGQLGDRAATTSTTTTCRTPRLPGASRPVCRRESGS